MERGGETKRGRGRGREGGEVGRETERGREGGKGGVGRGIDFLT